MKTDESSDTPRGLALYQTKAAQRWLTFEAELSAKYEPLLEQAGPVRRWWLRWKMHREHEEAAERFAPHLSWLLRRS